MNLRRAEGSLRSLPIVRGIALRNSMDFVPNVEAVGVQIYLSLDCSRRQVELMRFIPLSVPLGKPCLSPPHS
jgi:hypothetical protein